MLKILLNESLFEPLGEDVDKNKYLKSVAEMGWESGHPFNPDDFSYFKRVCKEDGYQVDEEDFQKYWEYFDECRANQYAEDDDNNLGDWEEVDSKQVKDRDGFMTDYTWYVKYNEDGSEEIHAMIFGDKDAYTPENSEPDAEFDSEERAEEWFDNYNGFAEDLDESLDIDDEDEIYNGYVVRKSDTSDNYFVYDNNGHVEDDEHKGQGYSTKEAAIERANSLEKGIAKANSDLEESLYEDFSPSLPKWLVSYLDHNEKVKTRLSNKGLDLANMQFVKIPRAEMPTNGFHPLMKDEAKQLVYLLRDEANRNIVYIPGINDSSISIAATPSDKYKYTDINKVSSKTLLQYTVLMGYIDKLVDSNLNSDKRKDRHITRKGSIERGIGQYASQEKVYPEREDGSRDYDAAPTSITHWFTSKGQDKSGYILNPTKYKDMLDKADMHTYSIQYERYTKKLMKLRDAIVAELQELRLDKTIGGVWGNPKLQYAVRYLEDAISSYEGLQEEIERILSQDNLTDDEKNKYIQDEFDASRHFNSITDLRTNIERAWGELNSYKERKSKLTEDKVIEEKTIYPDVESEKLNELAKKHNIEILSPMSNGDLRLSGAGADLMKFYQEAEELGLWEVDASLYESSITNNKSDKWVDNPYLYENISISELPEFKQIAEEVNLITIEDFKSLREEMLPEDKSELDTIRRYKQELIESGVIKLNEGVMKDIAIDLDNGETFATILKRDLVPAKKELQKLLDSEIADKEKIKEAEFKVDQIEAKLAYLKKLGK